MKMNCTKKNEFGTVLAVDILRMSQQAPLSFANGGGHCGGSGGACGGCGNGCSGGNGGSGGSGPVKI
ncbi:bacteriocin microcin [Mixta tenebrionis]|uniref:Bacteriocin microcin n=2 Tax=Mixta tenebrionis TaxID=2562439 RepID=A0A506VBK0_9GAMM|nr:MULTISPECIES: bacteriocin microcin [Mixta]TPW42928.1 bacteriocin microcin [Mixta tenebrionis]